MSDYSDPPEHVGRGNRGERADPPKGKRTAAPSVAVYAPPAKGEAHPRRARLAPALRVNAAEADYSAAQNELQDATRNLRTAELDMADAEVGFLSVIPARTQGQVHREMLAKETAAKLARVEQGLPPTPPKVISARSPVDIAAAQRPRQCAQQPSTALRSPVSRRVV